MIAYFDCFSGAAGDMILGALIDAGASLSFVREKLKALPLGDFEISAEPARRGGISALSVTVSPGEKPAFRDYAHIRELIGNADLSEKTRRLSLAVFSRLAEVEAKIHQCSKEKVHFHEVGGVDAVVDVVGAALCLEDMEIERVFVSPIPLARAKAVYCTHGTLPCPAPAALALLKNVPVYGVKGDFEMVTPTGAAILTTAAQGFGETPKMRISRIGYGAGKHNPEGAANLLRVLVGKADGQDRTAFSQDTVVVAEAAVDDMSPELFGFLMERLFSEGALDVYWIPAFMKKNRPAALIQVICTPDRADAVIRRIFLETTTTGVRQKQVERAVLDRSPGFADTVYGPVAVKIITGPDGETQMVPEYEACRKIALEKNLPLEKVYRAVLRGGPLPSGN